MSDFEDEVKKGVLLVNHPLEIKRYLEKGEKYLFPTFIWIKGKKTSYLSNVSGLNETDRTLHLKPKNFFHSVELESLLKDKGNQCIICMLLPNALFYFNTLYKGKSDFGLSFTMPSALYKIQRRHNARFTLPPKLSIMVTFQDPNSIKKTVEKKFHDISASGFSFLTSQSEADLYKKDTLLNNIIFSINGRNFCSEGIIRHTKVLPAMAKSKNLKVGVDLLKLTASEKDFIASFVLEESSKHFGKFLF